MEDTQLPGHIGLDPQARPTDQFKAPFHPRTLGGQGLLQLAGALKDFSSDASQMYDRLMPVYQQQQENKATQYNEQHQFQNMQDLKGAVDRGELPDYANPWLRVKLNNLVAVTEARNAGAQAYNDLRQDPAFHGDDVNAVNNFLTSKLQPLMQGKDSWQTAAMAPVLAQQHEDALRQWTEQRGQERINEANAATGANIMHSVNDLLGSSSAISPDAPQKLPGIISDIQQQYTHLTNVVDKATASEWISKAAFEAGRARRDADLTRSILEGVKGQDGIKLADLADNQAKLSVFPREIAELSVMDSQVQESKYNLQVEKDFHTLMNTAQDWAKKTGNTDIWQYKASFEDMKDKLPEAWDKYQKTMAAASAQNLQFQNDQWTREGTPIANKLWTDTFLNPAGIDPKEQTDLMSQLMTKGPVGRAEVKEYDYIAKSLRLGTFIWGDTSPQTMVEIVDRMNDQNLPIHDFHTYLLGLASGRRISEADFKWAMLNRHMQGGGEGNAMSFAHEVQNLTDQIKGAYTDPNNKNGLRLQDLENDPKYWQSVAGAERELQEGLIALQSRPDYKAMSPDQQLQKVKQLTDEIATHHGGWTGKQLVESNRNGDPLEQMGLKGPNASKPLTPAAPVEPAKPADSAPKSPTEAIEKFDPSAKGLEGYQKNALANYLKDSWFGSATFGREDYNAHLDRIYHNSILEGEAKAATAASINSPDSTADAAEKLTWIRATYPDWTKARDYKEGYAIGKDESYRGGPLGNEQAEIEQANLARTRLKGLTPVANVARKELDAILNDPQQPLVGSQPWLEKRDRVFELSNYVEEYSTLRKLVGFSPEEVKQAGGDSWKSMPMFVNEQEIKMHGEQVAASLGIKDAKDKADFIANQLKLTKLMRQQPIGQ